MWQIGAEGGLWDKPVPVKQLVLAPAERADVLVDFSQFSGARLPMTNVKPPRPISTPASPLTQVMQDKSRKNSPQTPKQDNVYVAYDDLSASNGAVENIIFCEATCPGRNAPAAKICGWQWR